jgi:ATP-dependent DNA ligase
LVTAAAVTPVTYDLAEAREWFEVLPAAMGVEGLVLKPTTARYAGGSRSSWEKIKHRDTREVIGYVICVRRVQCN